MNLNPSITGSPLAGTCMGLTISFSAPTTMTNLNYSTSFPMKNNPTKNLAIATTLTMRALSAMSLIDNELWCPNPTAVSFNPTNPFGVGVTYEIGSAAPTTTTAVSFSLTSPASCTDLVFVYTAKMQTTGLALPTFLIYSPATNIFSWPTVTSSNQGTYAITVKGTMNNNNFVEYTFTLVISSCATLILTPSSHADVSYLIVSPTALPVTVILTAFTSTKTASQCGALTYSLQIKDSSTNPATYTALTNPPYTYTAGALTFIISTNDIPTYDLQTH